LTSKILKELGVKAETNVNNRELLNEILDKEQVKNKEQVIREIDKLDKLPEKQVRANLRKYGAEKVLTIFKKPEFYFKRYRAYSKIIALKEYCKLYGIKINFQPSLARGLSYYNGSVFEIKTKGMKETICGGGSFLVSGIQATGISFGVERLSKLAKIKVKEKRVLVLSIGQDKEAVRLAEKLRKEEVNCEIMYGKPSKALEYTNSKGIEKVIFIGKEEIKKCKIKLRNMKTGSESFISERELIKKMS